MLFCLFQLGKDARKARGRAVAFTPESEHTCHIAICSMVESFVLFFLPLHAVLSLFPPSPCACSIKFGINVGPAIRQSPRIHCQESFAQHSDPPASASRRLWRPTALEGLQNRAEKEVGEAASSHPKLEDANLRLKIAKRQNLEDRAPIFGVNFSRNADAKFLMSFVRWKRLRPSCAADFFDAGPVEYPATSPPPL